MTYHTSVQRYALMMRLAFENRVLELSCALIDICTNFTTIDSTQTMFSSAALEVGRLGESIANMVEQSCTLCAAYRIDAMV